MKKRSKGCLLATLVVTVFCLFSGKTSEAAEDPLGFSVETVLPETQIDKNQTYFYVKVEPNKPQELKVKLKGTSETPVKVNIFTANATTAETGTILYKEGLPKDSTLKSSIEEITKISESEVELKKDEEKIITILVQPPVEKFEGIKLGTIYFERADGTEEDSDEMVKSSYSYSVGLMLSEAEGEYSDSQSLKLLDAKAELKRTKKTVQLTLQNPEPKMIADFSADVTIVEAKNGKVVKSQQLKEGAMAPNSRFDFSVDWGLDPMPAGDYIAKVKAKSRYKSWELEKPFTISGQQAKKINEETLFKLTLPTWAYVLTILLGVGTILLAIYLSVRGKKWVREYRKKMGQKKRKGKRPARKPKAKVGKTKNEKR
ncbi:DUF916 and DUF3324 domain-containing protein [Enterococcus sp. AZ126]|uniref:DUF916 and DUF3324 domain-containing protein n=1 Tax=Enterococcus sp. AZ126 TaxID=2774635 RepID=UPI003F245D0F